MSGQILTAEKYLSPQETNRFRRTLKVELEFAKCNNLETPIRDAAILFTVLGAGLRVSEARALKIKHLFLDQGRSELFIECSKGGKSRIVKIDRELKQHLKKFLKWKAQNNESIELGSHLFVNRIGNPYTTRAIQLRFHLYKKKSGITKDCGIHALRHTFALLLYRSSGHNLRLVQKQLGHSSIITTQVYADILDTDMKVAVEEMFSARNLVEV